MARRRRPTVDNDDDPSMFGVALDQIKYTKLIITRAPDEGWGSQNQRIISFIDLVKIAPKMNHSIQKSS